MKKLLIRYQPSTSQNQVCTSSQHHAAGVEAAVAVDALVLKQGVSCKLIPEVCGRFTKSLVFQTCNDDCVLARRLEPEVLSGSENISAPLG